jgi:hypothetical protein
VSQEREEGWLDNNFNYLHPSNIKIRPLYFICSNLSLFDSLKHIYHEGYAAKLCRTFVFIGSF